jgi:kynurenine formamidase
MSDARDKDPAHRISLRNPVSLAVPVRFDSRGVRHFGAPRARSAPLQLDGFTGTVAGGAGCNAATITVTPHCEGTHTECVGHLTLDAMDVWQMAPRGLMKALVVSVSAVAASAVSEGSEPAPQPNDLLITARDLRTACERAGFNASDEPWVEALIVRTLPNEPGKLTRDYTSLITPYFSRAAAEWLVSRQVRHWVVDLPSVDRTYDEGRLTAHRVFFGLPADSQRIDDATRADCTITEFAYVPDEVADGAYLLQLTMPAVPGDAVLSSPLLFRVTE